MEFAAQCCKYIEGLFAIPAYQYVSVCGTAITNGGAPTPIADCNMACSGNSTELCGGPNRLNVSQFIEGDKSS